MKDFRPWIKDHLPTVRKAQAASSQVDFVPPDVARLREFKPLDRLSDEQLILLLARGDMRTVAAGQCFIEAGSSDGRDYFLLNGAVRLESSDGRAQEINAGSACAHSAIAHLQPRLYRVCAVTSAYFLTVEQSILTQLLQKAPSQQVESSDDKMGRDAEDSDDYRLLMEFYSDLRANQLVLPSLPDVAFRVRKVADEASSTAEDIAKVVNADPAIAVKLVHASNSPLYHGFSEVRNTREAVVRLGTKTTRQLVTVFALREVFKSKRPELTEAMAALWDHSREVAAISWALAKALKSIDPEEALLAGLLHDIGEIPVINYADHYVNLFADYRALHLARRELRGEIGCALLEQWHFHKAFCEVAEHAEDWGYDGQGDSPRLVDLVIIAQLHAGIGKPAQQNQPAFSQVPAFAHMRGLSLTPQQSLQVLTDAREQIEQMKHMLAGH